MSTYDQLAAEASLQKTIEALKSHGIEAEIVANGEEAKNKVLSLIPAGAEVMTATSVTTDTIGLTAAINESGKYDAVKPKLYSMDRKAHEAEMQKLGAAPDYIVGSVHAVTEDGKVVIASNTGSQLPGYVYGSPHVIWVVGAQKITKDLDTALKRVYDYVLPLESERAHKAYGVAGSFVSKLLIVNKEVKPGRIQMIIVKEKLGF